MNGNRGIGFLVLTAEWPARRTVVKNITCFESFGDMTVLANALTKHALGEGLAASHAA